MLFNIKSPIKSKKAKVNFEPSQISSYTENQAKEMLPLKVGKIYVALSIGNQWIYGIELKSKSGVKSSGIFPKIHVVKIQFNDLYLPSGETDDEDISLIEAKNIIMQTANFIEQYFMVIGLSFLIVYNLI